MRRGLRFPKWAGRSERRKANRGRTVFGPSPYHRRLAYEPLEDRRLLAVVLSWSGSGSILSLTENLSGTTPTVTIPEPSPNISQLKIDLGSGHSFAGSSSTGVAGLTYQNATPATSQYAMVDVSLTNNISSLQAALPGDGLTLGQIRDLQGGVGGITGRAAHRSP